jgi:acylglycerol lipase
MTGLAGGIVGTARTRDGLELRTVHWPAAGTARAHLLLVHGIAEHAGRHAHVASRLALAGIETHAYDLRGFGASTGRRAYVARWPQHHDDLEDRLASVRALAGGLPVTLYGHSMGGLIALGYILADPPRRLPDLMVLSAPAIAAVVARWKRSLAEVLGRALPRLEVANDLPAGGLSRDPQVEVAYRSDPLNTHRTTARLGLELFREQARVEARLAQIGALPVPAYVLHGADDPIVPVSSSASLQGRENVTRRVYPGLRHETHNEPEATAVISDTIAWIEGSLARR